ncbi:MAG: transcription elongation factor GreA [Gammaproteobacteria bacterium WSBS_2016_MAG_OTU1]
MSIPITKEGQQKLQGELERLRNTERPAIVKAIAEARAHGDLSENAEYHSAKEKQGMIEARIKELDSILGASEVIDAAARGGNGRCIFGAYVTLEDEDDNIVKYRLVGEYEADIDKGLLSSTSPIGKALLGKTEGESVEVRAPGGVREYLIAKVAYKK